MKLSEVEYLSKEYFKQESAARIEHALAARRVMDELRDRLARSREEFIPLHRQQVTLLLDWLDKLDKGDPDELAQIVAEDMFRRNREERPGECSCMVWDRVDQDPLCPKHGS